MLSSGFWVTAQPVLFGSVVLYGDLRLCHAVPDVVVFGSDLKDYQSGSGIKMLRKKNPISGQCKKHAVKIAIA
jgi:hypothetical protein